MIPEHYFEVICCPKCKADLQANSEKDELFCPSCKSTYPVIEDIPVLLPGVEDEVSQIVKQFYDSEWTRNRAGVLKARVQHEDLSHLGQLYTKMNEDRFLSLFDPKRGQSFFLDAGAGAQPRVEFGSKYTYHICVDFSLDGLVESRKLLGERAICVCGSLLSMPLKDLRCDGIIASHVLYHIDKDLQGDAIRELHRVLRPEGKLLVFYRNPNSLEASIIKGKAAIKKGLNKVIGRKETTIKGENTLYYYSNSINHMLSILNTEFGSSRVSIKSLRMFTIRVTQKAFDSRLLGRTIFKATVLIEKILRRKPSFSSYVAYVAERSH